MNANLPEKAHRILRGLSVEATYIRTPIKKDNTTKNIASFDVALVASSAAGIGWVPPAVVVWLRINDSIASVCSAV